MTSPQNVQNLLVKHREGREDTDVGVSNERIYI
jgi:hypothetical protein